VRNFLVGLLWLWLLVSVGIYGYRIWRRVTRRTADGGGAGGADAAGGVDPVVADRPPTAAPAERIAPPSPATTHRTDTVPVIPPSPTASPPPTPAPATPDPASPTVDGRRGLFAPSSAGRMSDDAGPRPTVADVLQGISLPCDLAPIVDTDRPVDPHRVAFVTDRASPAEVGAALGDELERLGFSLSTVADNELEATRDDGRIVVTIHADPSTVTFGAAPAFPSAPRDGVVVEFRT